MSAAVAPEPTVAAPPEGKTKRVKKRLTSRTATFFAILIATLWTIPTFGLFISSFRPRQDINNSGWWTMITNPSFTFDNYVTVLSSSGASSASLGVYFVNSIVITLPAVVFPVTLALMAAYAFAWIPFKGSSWLFVLVFALQIVPLQMALIPLLKIFNYPWLDIGGTFPAVWIAHTIFGLPLQIFLLHNFISEIPRDVMEAAKVDGANHAQIFRRVVIPLSVPAIASMVIFQFLWVWNDLLVALVFSGGTAKTAPITQRVAEFAGTRGNQWELLTSAAFIATIVPLIVFFALQRYFVRGLLAGSTKG
ncbi:carbohydrate ABC transporter permease [Demequina lignilytica]|uniref:Carbohydrate ABC transporter permease n=1 Tax=Demequina lignilytica TaxID=3051663 RepID=A0AAW7M455_9MICO|nr:MULTISPECIES: carbohydrate ABC transporter permease [unclassified Demequina]MDN4478706.1 carbohydrate ABC transporter permease [Demequina sp. SYSU T00039-1]MDN4483258.1 carbohydrate ABC transporter permease [Demequina sp. SYSU T0a273]MDN4488684.1 carbohydrate ABC transporter permease [Demequina sp. SYSU T00039]MDN4491860.1 carbohydrate ABC transporter permease [Demequina sp. SYSU T00068]